MHKAAKKQKHLQMRTVIVIIIIKYRELLSVSFYIRLYQILGDTQRR